MTIMRQTNGVLWNGESVMDETPAIVMELVERFDRDTGTYRSSAYNEAQLRREFLDPLFEALEWDVTNKAGYADLYKDVVHEDTIRVGAATKAPDYCFRIGGTRKFFLEAKRPSVDIKANPEAAYQLRRYAWSAKLPISVLCDFEEFAIYDTRIKPNVRDKASTARVFFCNYRQYGEKWPEISAILSKSAVLKGSFDKFSGAMGSKRGTAEVDQAFLAEIEAWRKSIAENIALRNASVTERELNTAVTLTIDRLIFLRMCEDRGIERYGQLQTLAKVGDIYGELLKLFRRADDKYNSGLFHFAPEKGRHAGHDELTPGLAVDDATLKPILQSLYYPESPYEFSVLPAEILGHVYEQFLGKVISLTAGHRARIELKPDVRRAGGVFYTPKYVVDYIVSKTLGVLLSGKTDRDAAKIKLLDPACGSGSFLLGAYQFLLDWHVRYYSQTTPEAFLKQRVAPIYEVASDAVGARRYRLSTSKKKEILLNSIFGVDIDANAVETTKLSLLLKVLEGESGESIENQLKLFRVRALPDLADNIKCGNSLVGPDYYRDRQLSLADDALRYKLNVFDWEIEFKAIMSSGGFSAVIGNPPWGANVDDELDYYHAKYPDSTSEHTDSFKLFVDKGLSLARESGKLSFIVPGTLLRQRRLRDIRRLILSKQLEEIVDLGEDVFEDVVAPACVFVLAKRPAPAGHRVAVLDISADAAYQRAEHLTAQRGVDWIFQSDFIGNQDGEFMAGAPGFIMAKALEKIPDFRLKDAGINYQRKGVGMRRKGDGDLALRLLYEGRRERQLDRMYWKGSDIERYKMARSTQRFCRPDFAGFIRRNETVRLDAATFSQHPKILIRQTADRPIATLDTDGVWFGRSVIAVVGGQAPRYALQYLLALLNSKLICYIYRQMVKEKGRVFAQVKLSKLKRLPIREIDFNKDSDIEKYHRIIALVDTILALNRSADQLRSPVEKESLRRQIDAVDRDIDQLVYDLYALSSSQVAAAEQNS